MQLIAEYKYSPGRRRLATQARPVSNYVLSVITSGARRSPERPWLANGDPARTSEERRTEADSDQRYGASGAAQLSTVAFVLPSSSARTSDSR